MLLVTSCQTWFGVMCEIFIMFRMLFFLLATSQAFYIDNVNKQGEHESEIIEDNRNYKTVFDNTQDDVLLFPPGSKKPQIEFSDEGADTSHGGWWEEDVPLEQLGVHSNEIYSGEKAINLFEALKEYASTDDFEREDVNREDVEHIREFPHQFNLLPRKASYLASGIEGDVDEVDDFAHDPQELRRHDNHLNHHENQLNHHDYNTDNSNGARLRNNEDDIHDGELEKLYHNNPY